MRPLASLTCARCNIYRGIALQYVEPPLHALAIFNDRSRSIEYNDRGVDVIRVGGNSVCVALIDNESVAIVCGYNRHRRSVSIASANL